MNNRILLVSAAPIAAGISLFLAFNPTLLNAQSLPSPIRELSISDGFKQTIVLDPTITNNTIIPAQNYTARGYKDIGLQYPPAATANKCLFYFSHAKNETAWSYGIYMADWFSSRAERADGYMAFAYDFDWKAYNLTKGWKSALGQSSVAECFMEAYKRTHDEKYLEYAKQTFLYLNVPIFQGGVMIDEGENKWWYEEFPSKGGSYVLNSDQSVLIALSRYLDIQKDPEIRVLFDNGMNAMKADALKYDNGANDSYYDRLGHPALKYHQTHIANFQKLYDITKDPEFLEFKKAFEE